MFGNSLIHSRSKLLILLILFVSQVTASDETTSNPCAEYNEKCNPEHKRPCCNPDTSCKFKESRNDFYCGYKAKLGTYCENEEDCSDVLHAICPAEKRCVCREHNRELNHTYCAPSLGAFCWKEEKCATDNATCIDSQCQCNENYHQSNDQCLRPVIGSYCENDEACEQIKFAKCSQLNICICSLNTIVINGSSCLPLLDVPCRANDYCKVHNSICVDDKCQCHDKTLRYSNHECLISSLDMECETNLFCENLVHHSICSKHKKCICDFHNYIRRGNKCILAFNEECSADDGCTTVNAVCINNKCECKHNHIYQESKCVPMFLNETCYTHSDCDKMRFTMCSTNHKCVCRDKYIVMNKTTCVPSLGAACTEQIHCEPENLICIDNMCQFKTNFSLQSNHTDVQIALGSRCQLDADCATIKNSGCSLSKKCVCNVNTFASNKFTCSSTLNGLCFSDNDCYLNSFHCLNNKCRCKQNYTSISVDRCVEDRLLYSCSNSLDCSDPWHSHCSNNGKCVCQSNNIAISISTCLPTLRGQCWRDDQCMTMGSICIDFQCTCKSNFIAIAENLCMSTDESS